jgi:hypothetical protein
MTLPNIFKVIFLFREDGWIPPVSTGTSQTAHNPFARGNDGLQPGYVMVSPINQTARGIPNFSHPIVVQFDFMIDGIRNR